MKEITFREYVEQECKRQWRENQESEHGSWESQTEETKKEYFDSMYEHLIDEKDELDGIAD